MIWASETVAHTQCESEPKTSNLIKLLSRLPRPSPTTGGGATEVPTSPLLPPLCARSWGSWVTTSWVTPSCPTSRCTGPLRGDPAISFRVPSSFLWLTPSSRWVVGSGSGVCRAWRGGGRVDSTETLPFLQSHHSPQRARVRWWTRRRISAPISRSTSGPWCPWVPLLLLFLTQPNNGGGFGRWYGTIGLRNSPPKEISPKKQRGSRMLRIILRNSVYLAFSPL